MTYNILYEPWMLVRYLDGTAKRIGVKQAFKDAKLIREVLPPVMYGNKQYFAAFTNIHLLAVIAMAANFKPANRFAAKSQDVWEDQLSDGMDLQTILDYLDTYAERFDIFSATHPFLQNIKYAEQVVGKDMFKKGKRIIANDIKYISNANPFAPSANNAMTGSKRTYTSGHDYPIPLMHYQMTPADFTQVLVYSPWCASSAPGQYPVNLYNQTNVAISPYGENLEETILRHCVAIPNSARPNVDEPDKLYDRPRWEWDSEEECFLHPRSDMLANAFFNGVEMLAAPGLNQDGFIEYIHVATTAECLHPTAGKAEKAGYPAFQRDRECSDALCYNPYTVKRLGEFEDGAVKFIAAEYNLSKTASSLFLAATKQLEHDQKAHILYSNADAKRIRLYYRTYSDAYHALIDNQGILEMPVEAMALLDPNKHAAATAFQEKYSKIIKPFAKALRMIDVTEANITCRVRELSHIARDAFMAMVREFGDTCADEYDAVTSKHLATIKSETRSILEAEGKFCRSAIEYNKAWDHLIKNTHKI